MRYNRLGQTGLFVSELCLGTMTFGGSEGMWGQIGSLGQDEAERLVARALDAGINFIDTADVYAGGRSEEITGQALQEPQGAAARTWSSRPRSSARPGQGPNARGNSRAHILAAVKDSLRRLQLDHIDLYQIHGFDPATPIEETVRALETLVQHGHVRYVGVSNWAAWQIVKALGIAERLGLAARIQSLQAYYTIAGRDLERELVPMMRSEGVGLMVWSPLAGGLLSGKYGRDRQGEQGSRRIAFDFPPVRPGARLGLRRCDARHRRGARRLGGPGGARLAAAPAACHERDRRCQAPRSARRQYRRHDGEAHGRRARRPRRGQPPAGRVSRLDVRAPGRLSDAAAGRRRAALSRVVQG